MMYAAKYHWGRHMWNYIHSITIVNYLSEQDNLRFSKNIYDYLFTLKFLCNKCQQEYEDELLKIDINSLSKPMYLFEWSWNLHNKINNILNKPIITYEEALEIHTVEAHPFLIN